MRASSLRLEKFTWSLELSPLQLKDSTLNLCSVNPPLLSISIAEQHANHRKTSIEKLVRVISYSIWNGDLNVLYVLEQSGEGYRRIVNIKQTTLLV